MPKINQTSNYTLHPETLELLTRFQSGKIPDVLLKQPTVEQLTSLAASTLEQHRLKGNGIPFVRIGRSIRYRLSDVVRFIGGLPAFNSTAQADAHQSQGRA